jgi:DNA-binding NarL/FixJ family response regulator
MGSPVELRSSPAVRVYLLAENRLLRDTLGKVLRKRPEIDVVGVGRRSDNIKEDVIAARCEVLLTDCFDVSGGAAFLHNLLETDLGIRLLLFGMSEDSNLFLKAVNLGISAYLLKEASAAEIVAAVRAIVRGHATCPPSLCMVLLKHLGKNRAGKIDSLDRSMANPRALTPRQLQLLRLVANGLTNKEIAANLHLSEFTVKNHLKRIMRQVEAEDRHEAVALVRAAGDLAIV